MRTILGIDPGISILGFGVMKQEPRGYVLVDYGILPLSSSESIAKRLLIISDFLKNKIVCAYS